MGYIFKNESVEVQLCPHVNTSPSQSFILRTEPHIIIASFISESGLSIYGLGQKFICWKLKRFGTLVMIGIHTLMEHEQENTIPKNKNKKTSKLEKYCIVLLPYLWLFTLLSSVCNIFHVLFVCILTVAHLQIEKI